MNTMYMIMGIIGMVALYILGEDFFKGKNKAIVFDNGAIKIVAASQSKEGKQCLFKYNKIKYSPAFADNEFRLKNKTVSLWEIKNKIALPLTKNESSIKIEDINGQIQMINALRDAEKKVDENFWDRNKEAIVGLAAIVGGVFVYVMSVKYAANVSPENLNACLQMAADIKNSTLTTESNINAVVDILKESKIPR